MPRTLPDFCDISFRFVQPQTVLPAAARNILERKLPPAQWGIDVVNARIPFLSPAERRSLLRLSWMPKMSTLAIGSVIHAAVRAMPDDACYLNIGTWLGYSLFAGMRLNPEKTCIGVDDFSEFGGPRAGFSRRFDALKALAHSFVESDWRQYMAKHHQPIGVFFYDGPHDEASQYDALVVAEPFLIPGAVIIVDDMNWNGPNDATRRFLAARTGYEILLDQPTSCNCHPTFWNGVIVLRKCS